MAVDEKEKKSNLSFYIIIFTLLIVFFIFYIHKHPKSNLAKTVDKTITQIKNALFGDQEKKRQEKEKIIKRIEYNKQKLQELEKKLSEKRKNISLSEEEKNKNSQINYANQELEATLFEASRYLQKIIDEDLSVPNSLVGKISFFKDQYLFQKNRFDKLKEEIEGIKTEIKTRETELKEVNQQIATLSNKIKNNEEANESEIEELQQKLNQCETEIQHYKTQLKQKNKETEYFLFFEQKIKKLDSIRENISKLNKEMQEIRKKNAIEKLGITELTTEIEKLQNKIEEDEEKLENL